MKYNRVFLESFGYELAPVVVSTSALEKRLAPIYSALRIPAGQLEAMTGIRERRWWEEGEPLYTGAIAAARKAVASSGIPPDQIGAVIYGGVCRENKEPASAYRIADAICAGINASVHDVSNACLGVVNGIIDIANRIELGQIRAGIAVSCESAREINEIMLKKLNSNPTMENFKLGIATFTGGSGAVAAVLSDGNFHKNTQRPKLLGGISRTAPEHFRLCTWGYEEIETGNFSPFMSTDSVAVLKEGVLLGTKTFADFREELNWSISDIDRVICHQVGSGHQEKILAALGIAPEKDTVTYTYLGNTGTVALPLTAALAWERKTLKKDDRVAFLGIGSGLGSIMLGWEW